MKRILLALLCCIAVASIGCGGSSPTSHSSHSSFCSLSSASSICSPVASTGDFILLKATTFAPPEEPGIPDDLKYTEHRSYYLIQLTETITTQIRDELLAAGVDFVDYIPNQAYIVKMTLDTKVAVECLPFINYVGPCHPAYKMPYLYEATGTLMVAVLVFENANATVTEIKEAIEALGGTILGLGYEPVEVSDEVTLCHFLDPGTAETMRISQADAAGYLAQGDFLGPCECHGEQEPKDPLTTSLIIRAEIDASIIKDIAFIPSVEFIEETGPPEPM
jgi:hypothetical protein